MKKKILLVDYYGTCDEKGKPIGHSAKVLKEYSELISDEFEIGAAISPCLRSNIDNIEHIYPLKYDIRAYRTNSIFHRILDKFKLFANIRQVLKIKGYDIIWFYRTDFFLFLYFCIFVYLKKTKMVAQIYQDSFADGILGKILYYFYQKGVRKFDGLIFNQKGMGKEFNNVIYIPDYCYYEEKYGVYRKMPKQEKVACFGTMNPYKKLEELVDVFNHNGYKLEIKGYFYDKNRYQKLLEMKKDHITIEDRILTEEEYYSFIAESKYSILPYDMVQYAGRTSGVLQESLFLNSIIIAPDLLLRQNHFSGLAYDDIYELHDFDKFLTNHELPTNNSLDDYKNDKIKEKVNQFFKGLFE